MYDARSYDGILAELKKYSELPCSKIEGTFENDVLASNAIEFSKIEVELEEACKQSFLDTATGEYLTMRAKESGTVRRKATKAIGTVTVSGNGTVPKGSIFSTVAGTQFITVADTVISSSGDIEVMAVKSGEDGNVAEETIIQIPMSIPGIIAVTNREPTYNGYSEETDEILRERALEHARNPGTSGNPRHYIEWATSVSGVGTAKVIRAWNGANTVKVVIVDSNFEEASEELIREVSKYIEERRTINAIVTVSSAKAKIIDISADIIGNINNTVFKEKINSYFADIEKKSWNSNVNTSVTCTKIGAILLEAGAEDYNNLLLNDDNKNIITGAEEIPKLGQVIFNG